MASRDQRQERMMARAQRNHASSAAVDSGPEEFWNDTIALIREALKPDFDALQDSQTELRTEFVEQKRELQELRADLRSQENRFDQIDNALRKIQEKLDA